MFVHLFAAESRAKTRDESNRVIRATDTHHTGHSSGQYHEGATDSSCVSFGPPLETPPKLTHEEELDEEEDPDEASESNPSTSYRHPDLAEPTGQELLKKGGTMRRYTRWQVLCLQEQDDWYEDALSRLSANQASGQ
jgi:hypothetical protein